MNSFFILTGGPGTGKTTILDLLKEKGYCVVEEAARQIIKEQNAMGGNKTHTGDQQGFCQLLLAASMINYQHHQHRSGLVFFDRGIPDLLGYANMIGLEDKQTIIDIIQQYRYNHHVFIFPPWKEIYRNDQERLQDYEEAVNTYYHIKKAYEDSGYCTIEVPKTSPTHRVAFMLDTIKEMENH